MDGINLGSEQPHLLAVDADAPGQNDLFTRAARSHAGVGKKFLKSNVQSADCGARSAESDNARLFIPHSAFRIPHGSHVGFGFAEAGDAVAVLPLAAFLEDFGALEAFEDIALAAKGGRRAQTAML
jgi:hypothetical protein